MFKGSFVAIVTPMLMNGEIDLPKFQMLIDWHLSNGTQGLVVLGTTGESATIEADEREQLIAAAVDQIHNRVPLVVGTGTNATASSIRLTQQAMELGADACLLVTPYYNKPTQQGLLQHFQAIAHAVAVPLILYNVPSRTSCDLLPKTVKSLAACGNIIGLKEATGDLARLKALLDLDCGLELFSGDDKTACEFMLEGGKGVISVTANVAPQKMRALCDAALAGDRAEALRLDGKLLPLHEQLFVEANPIPAKWALAEMGRIDRGIRLPLTALAPAYHDQLRDALRQLNII